MIATDKWIIRINRLFRNLLFHLIFWYASFLFYVFLTGTDYIVIIHLNLLQLDNLYLILLVLSAGVSVLFTLLDGIFFDRLLRFMPRRLMIFFKSLLYFATAFILILLAARPSLSALTSMNSDEILKAFPQYFPEMDLHFFRFLVYFYVSGFLVNFIKTLEKRVGRRNLRNLTLGLLNKPMEEERIFMFIDMKSSTAIAEKLKHKKYSHLVQDVFNDLSVVDNYRGEIYQYLGDGAIISWKLNDGLKRNNFLHAYFAFKKVIHKRRRYYNRKYGDVPGFKAGAHAGEVMVLQVGKIRRDISYNGDTINTAARIESMCNEYRQDLLISGYLHTLMKDEKGFAIKQISNKSQQGKKIKLKGKSKSIDIYQVKEKA